MSALNTNKLIKIVPNTGWQLNSSGIADVSSDSFGLVSASGLPTDTAVMLTIDRVDSSGNKTPSKMERIIGVINGNNVVNCIRGVEGAAQAHTGGAVVEIVIVSTIWNKIIEHLLTEHNQDGSHSGILGNIDEEHNTDGSHIDNLSLTKPTLKGSVHDIASATDEATITFDCEESNVHKVTLGGNRTLALDNISVGQVIILRLKQDATGNRTVTWFSGISWAGGSAPDLTTTASKTDVFGLLCTAEDEYDGFVIGQEI